MKLQSPITKLTLGLVGSLACTLAAYQLVYVHDASGHLDIAHSWLVAGVVALALVQLFVQLRFFLHVGDEAKPRWNALALGFAAIVVSILVFGTIWIMKNLEYHHGEPTQTDRAIIQDEGFDSR